MIDPSLIETCPALAACTTCHWVTLDDPMVAAAKAHAADTGHVVTVSLGRYAVVPIEAERAFVDAALPRRGIPPARVWDEPLSDLRYQLEPTDLGRPACRALDVLSGGMPCVLPTGHDGPHRLASDVEQASPSVPEP